MPYEPIIPDGQHLGTSHQVDGAVTGHLFDDAGNKLQGHAAWHEIPEPDVDFSSIYEDEPPRKLTQEELELAAKIAAIIVIFVAEVVVAVKPDVERWWNQKAVPSARSAWKRVTTRRKADRASTAATVAAVPPQGTTVFVASATGVEVAVAESKVTMSSAEWAHRFEAALAAVAFKNQQLSILASARIEDNDHTLEASNTTDELTPQQFADRIRLELEANPELLTEETVAELTKILNTRSNPPPGSGRHRAV